MFDIKTLIEIAGFIITITATIVGLQWRVSNVEKTGEARAADLERSVSAIGAKLDDARQRLTAAETTIRHQDGYLGRIETAITAATARLEVKIGDIQRQIVDALANRKDG